jgi:two-component system chemotaxis response regulator CheY
MSNTVLVCDDALFMRAMIRQTLEQAGYEIAAEAEDGLQAVDRYKQVQPDAVTMDIVMPKMGGIETVREIKRLDPDARILVCSAVGQEALADEALKAGAREYIVKPFQTSQFLGAMERTMSRDRHVPDSLP